MELATVEKGAVKVLLVDDIRENLMALAALVAQPEVQPFVANSGTEALELLLEHDFALALIDVQMPQMNGFDLAKIMRSTERTRHIPIVFVTAGSVEPSHAFRGYESGAIDFLYKPLDNHTVSSKVNVFVELYRQRRELKRQVHALQQAQAEQQRLLEQLQQTEEELRKAMRLRDDFISVVSHELRTPLNTLKLELYTRRIHVENGNAEAFTLDKVETMIGNDERQLDRLVRLINDMTDVSRIRTGQLSMRPSRVDVVALAQRVIEQFSSQIARANSTARVVAGEPVIAGVDEFRIEQALTNLLTNAIRHCDSKPIEISVQNLTRGEVPHIEIAVRDFGKGIKPEDQRRIFEQFERGVNERKGSGLGLGLFIANQIAQGHSGTLSVESEPEEGAKFTLVVPRDFVFD